MLKFLRCVVVALVLTPTIGAAQDFQAGLAAHAAGDYATALSKWRPLAEQAQQARSCIFGRFTEQTA